MARWMQMTLLSWMVLELTDSAWRVALVGFSATAPMLLFGLVGGVLADSVNRGKLLKATHFASLLAAVCMTVVLFLGKEQFWHAYIVMFVVGSGWALDMPTRRSLIHDLLGRAGVTNALALDTLGMAMTDMLGPSLAGVLITLVGVEGGYVVVCAFYLVSNGLVSMLRVATRVGGSRTPKTIGRDLVTGMRYSWAQPTLLAVIFITIVMNLLLFPYRHMMPVVARDDLGVGPLFMGLLQAAPGIGATFGAFAIATATDIRRHGLIFLGGSSSAMVVLFLFSLSPWYALAFPLAIAIGVSTAGFSTMQSTLIVLVSPEAMRGKTLGVISLAIGAGPIGALLVGAIAENVGAARALTYSAGVGIGCLLVIWLLMPAIRRKTDLSERVVGQG